MMKAIHSLFDNDRRQAIRGAIDGKKDLKALLRGSKKGPEPPVLAAEKANRSKAEQERLNLDLLRAASEGNIEMVRELIDKGADLDAMTVKGVTPLIAASYDGHLNVVELLLQCGADANAGMKYFCIDKNIKNNVATLTALNYASVKGYQEIAELLRKHGAR